MKAHVTDKNDLVFHNMNRYTNVEFDTNEAFSKYLQNLSKSLENSSDKDITVDTYHSSELDDEITVDSLVEPIASKRLHTKP